MSLSICSVSQQAGDPGEPQSQLVEDWGRADVSIKDRGQDKANVLVER